MPAQCPSNRLLKISNYRLKFWEWQAAAGADGVAINAPVRTKLVPFPGSFLASTEYLATAWLLLAGFSSPVRKPMDFG
jgi:hypothetical protein